MTPGANNINITRNLLSNSTNYSIGVINGVNITTVNNTFINNTWDFNITSNNSLQAMNSTVTSLNNSFNRTGIAITNGDHLFNISWFVKLLTLYSRQAIIKCTG